MTCSGGDSAIAADLAAKLGVELPALAPATIARLERALPDAATAANPLDYTSLLWDDTEALRELIAALGDDPAVGQVLVLFDEFDGPAPILDAVGDSLLASTLPELCPPGGIAGLRSALLAAKALTASPIPSGSPRSAARAGPTAATGSRSTRRRHCCVTPAFPSSPAGRSATRMRPSPPGASSAARSRSSAPGCATSPSTAG